MTHSDSQDRHSLKQVPQPAAAFLAASEDCPTIPPRTRDSATEPMSPSKAPEDAGTFGSYEILGEIARGGMGVVYKARQCRLNRLVALKMILAGRLASPQEVQRFQTEADAAANLDHPGIVPIFEVGEHEGQHFFSMAFVDGESLADRLKRGPLPPREAAMLLRCIAEAVQHAHDKGIIHRDLKPANVLLEKLDRANDPVWPESELSPQLPYRPRITDFGLARRVQSSTHLTGSGDVVGTPSYMPPEQASGKLREIKETADVYALGAILYVVLTGRPPFQAATSIDTLMQVLDTDPAAPRLLNPNVPRDLEAVCLKCLEKDPARRYAAARLLADELQRFLDGEPIQASSVNVLSRVLHTLRKERHEENFRGWGVGLMSFGLVIFVAHAAIYTLEQAGFGPLTAYWLPRAVMVLVMIALLWGFRHQSIWPTNSAERLIWVVWIGYLLGVGSVSVTLSIADLDPKLLYAFAAVLSGIGFCVMGVHVWGGAYVIAMTFLCGAPVLGWLLPWASLTFGGLWATALLSFGLHYWRPARSRTGTGT